MPHIFAADVEWTQGGQLQQRKYWISLDGPPEAGKYAIWETVPPARDAKKLVTIFGNSFPVAERSNIAALAWLGPNDKPRIRIVYQTEDGKLHDLEYTDGQWREGVLFSVQTGVMIDTYITLSREVDAKGVKEPVTHLFYQDASGDLCEMRSSGATDGPWIVGSIGKGDVKVPGKSHPKAITVVSPSTGETWIRLMWLIGAKGEGVMYNQNTGWLGPMPMGN